MKIDKNILIMSQFPKRVITHFDETFNTFKLYEHLKKEKYLTDISEKIDGIAVMGPTVVSADIINSLPKLKIIGNFGVGFDAIDIKKATDENIRVTNTPNVLNDEVADTAVALTLSVYRKIIDANQFLLNKSWLKSEFPLSRKFSGTKFGILGMVRIGKAIAQRIQAFNCDVSYHSRNKKDVSYKYFSKLEDLAEHVDTLCVITPGGNETKHLVNNKVLKKLGKKGVIINIARGSVIDQIALIDALKTGVISGAGLDVFDNEPNVPEDLMKLNNVVLLPHVGSATVETRYEMGKMVYDNIVAFFKNEQLLSPVN